VIYLLDTNACIGYLNDNNSLVAQKMATLRLDEIALCSIVAGELYYGAYHSSRRASNLALVDLLFQTFTSLPFDHHAAEVYGRIRADLASAGTLIGPLDLQIAAIALANGLTLVTHNTREFGRVNGLSIEDWETPTP
jgi:tRNA(fMet)-specific endonuclease VapC